MINWNRRDTMPVVHRGYSIPFNPVDYEEIVEIPDGFERVLKGDTKRGDQAFDRLMGYFPALAGCPIAYLVAVIRKIPGHANTKGYQRKGDPHVTTDSGQ